MRTREPLPLLSLAAAAALSVLSAPQVHAATVALSNAAFASVYVRDCRSPEAIAAGATAPNRCEAGPPLPSYPQFVENKFQASLGGFVASATAANPLAIVGDRASTSYVDASGPAGTMILKQRAVSDSVARVSGHSNTLQSFQWTGETGVRKAVSGTLDFQAQNYTPPPAGLEWNNPAARTFSQAAIRIFSLSTPTFDYNSSIIREFGPLPWFMTAASARADYRYEAGTNANQQFVQTIPASSCDSTGYCVYTFNHEFTVETGRYYFVESWLGLWSLFGAEIDATSTMISELGANVVDPATGQSRFVRDDLTQPGGFTPAAPAQSPVSVGNAVPAPGALALALTGLALMAAVRRRRV